MIRMGLRIVKFSRGLRQAKTKIQLIHDYRICEIEEIFFTSGV